MHRKYRWSLNFSELDQNGDCKNISAIQFCVYRYHDIGNVHRFQSGSCEVNHQTAKFNSLIILFVVVLNYTHPECHISTVFLHLSEQCLDEGGLTSSNLTHHSHQLTWLHAKVNSVCDKVTISPLATSYFFSVLK